MKKILAKIKRFITGSCGTVLYFDGCKCIDCKMKYINEYKKVFKDDYKWN